VTDETPTTGNGPHRKRISKRRHGKPGEPIEKTRLFQYVALAAGVASVLGFILAVPGAFTDHSTANSSHSSTSTAQQIGAGAFKQATSSPRPASSSSPPVVIESVSRMVSHQYPPGTMVLARPLSMSSSQLAAFDTDIYPDSAKFAAWAATYQPITNFDQGITTVTLVGNWNEPVHVSDIHVLKSCGPPLQGTYFRGYSQGGGGGGTIQIGLNLDEAQPVPEEMAQVAGRGLIPDGSDFFAVRSIDLKKGESVALAIAASTTRYSCSFSLQLDIATVEGVFTEIVDNGAAPFTVTATARPTSGGAPYSGYQDAYALYPDASGSTGPPHWHVVDPATYTGR
jgi:hypothetical protein